jgi:acetolactate synthase-1/2/3 large subunit
MIKEMLGCEYIASLFKEYGVTHVFKMEAMLRMAVREMEALGIKIIQAHSENAIGYMADGYARVSGHPGVCIAQSIGAANMVGGIHDAWLGITPIIALTGRKPSVCAYRNCYQESEHLPMYASVTKFNAEMHTPDQLPFLLRQSFREAVTGKPRPVHLDIPNHIGRLIEAAKIHVPFLCEPEYGQYPAFRFPAPPDKVMLAASAINDAASPVIVAGRGASISKAGKEILALAEKNSIPVITTPDAKTLIDEDHPLWAGIAGGYGMRCASETILASDLVIFIGTQTNDQTTRDWTVPEINTNVIQIDIDPSELGKNYPRAIGLLGDAKTVATQLTDIVVRQERTEWREKAANYLVHTLQRYNTTIHAETAIIKPERLCYELSRVLPDDVVLLSDTGFSAIWTSGFIRMKSSQDYYRAAGSLGWAFPAAIGAKCAVPDRPVVCFIGDGGFYYHLGEIETAIRYGIAPVIVVNNNGGLAQASADIKKVFKNVSDTAADTQYKFQGVRFAVVAKELGAYTELVTCASDIGPAVERSLAAGRLAVVEVITDIESLVPDM